MVDPDAGKAVSGRDVIEEVLNSGVGSVNADKAGITEQFDIDNSEFSHFGQRTFEQSGAPSFQPHPDVDNPIFTPSDITDRSNVYFMADPFLAYQQETGQYHLFFELQHDDDNDGARTTEIAHATSPDGLNWSYDQVVLDRTNHLTDGNEAAYAFILKWQGDWYLIPDRQSKLQIFRATNTALTSWEEVEVPIDTGGSSGFSDPTPFYLPWQNRWYIMVNDSGSTDLWYADQGRSITGRSWSEHPNNPIHTSADNQRPAGRPIVVDESCIWTFYMDVNRSYGDKVRCRKISDISPTAFTDHESGVVLQGNLSADSWRGDGMHNVDAMMPYVGGPDIVAVDGKSNSVGGDWRLGIYTTGRDFATMTATKAVPSANQSFASGAVDPVQFDSFGPNRQTAYDNARTYDTTNYEYSFPVSGTYKFRAKIHFNGTSGTAPFESLARVMDRDNANELGFSRVHLSTTSGFKIVVDGEVQVEDEGLVPVGTSIGVDAYQDSGASVALDSNKSYFAVRRVA